MRANVIPDLEGEKTGNKPRSEKNTKMLLRYVASPRQSIFDPFLDPLKGSGHPKRNWEEITQQGGRLAAPLHLGNGFRPTFNCATVKNHVNNLEENHFQKGSIPPYEPFERWDCSQNGSEAYQCTCRKARGTGQCIGCHQYPPGMGRGSNTQSRNQPTDATTIVCHNLCLIKKKSYNTGETHWAQLDQVCTKHACPVQCESHTLQNFRLISFPSFLIKSRKMLDIGSRPLEIRLNNIYMRPRSKKEERGSRQWQCILIVENDDGGCPNSTLKRNVAEIENFISDWKRQLCTAKKKCFCQAPGSTSKNYQYCKIRCERDGSISGLCC